MTTTVYSALKPFHFTGHLAAMRVGEIPPPVHVRIKPTNVCNHGCYFCAYRSDSLSLGEDMNSRDRIPREKMLEIIEDLKVMGVRAVTFSGGGEPLIYPYFAETVEKLGAAGIKIGCLSNGSQLRGKVADAMAQHATWLRISIDGWDGISYAQSRSVPVAEFDKVIDNIAAFSRRESECTVGASLIVDRANAGHLAELAGNLKLAGVAHVKVSACIVSNDGAENNRYHASIEATVKRQIGLMRCLEDDGFAVIDHYHRLPEMFTKDYERCSIANMLTVIGADACVYSCQDKAYTDSGRLGSLDGRRFLEFWFSKENKARLSRLNPRAGCRHHCVADAKNRALNDYLATDDAHIGFV